MASVLPSQLGDLELSKLPARAQQELKLRQQRLSRRIGKVQRDVTRRRQLLAGKLHDESLKTIYARTSDVVAAASALLEMAPAVSPVMASTRRLDEASMRLSSKLGKLETPAIPHYDDLNVKQVNEALADLGAHELRKVERYERDHKNRVTVLREVERLMTR